MSNFDDLFDDLDDELTNISSTQGVIIEPIGKKNKEPAPEVTSEVFFDEDAAVDEPEMATGNEPSQTEGKNLGSFLLDEEDEVVEPAAEPSADEDVVEDIDVDMNEESDAELEPEEILKTEPLTEEVEPEFVDEEEDLDSFLSAPEVSSEAEPEEDDKADVDSELQEILTNMEEFGYSEEDVSSFSKVEQTRLHQILKDISIATDDELFAIRKSLGLEKQKKKIDTEETSKGETAKPSIIGEKLKFLRERVGMSLDDVAEDCGVSEEDILAYETGDKKPDSYDLKMLAGAYGVTLSEILEDKDFVSRPKEKKVDDISELEDYQEMEDEKEDNAPIEEYEEQESDDEPEVEDTDDDTELSVTVPEVKTSGKKKKEKVKDIKDDDDESDDIEDEDDVDDKPKKTSGFEKALIIIVCLCMIAFAAFGAALVYYGVSNGKFTQIEQSTEMTETEIEALPENFQ